MNYKGNGMITITICTECEKMQTLIDTSLTSVRCGRCETFYNIDESNKMVMDDFVAVALFTCKTLAILWPM